MLLRRSLAASIALLLAAGIVPAPPALAAASNATVVAVRVEGNAKVPIDRILGAISTKAGDPFDPARVQNDLRAIADLGFFADQAPPVIKQQRDGIAITFRVIENPVVTSIRFDGNTSVSAETLLALMDTAPGQVFNVKTYQQDVLKINSYYDKVGFGGQLPSHVTDVAITPAGVLTISLHEGLTVRRIHITTAAEGADPVLPPNVIEAALVTKAGRPYSEAQRDKDYEAIKALYEKYDLKVGDVEAGIDPSTTDQKAGSADVRYTISALRVGAVEITGNTKTHDDVIRRELRLMPGMLVSDSALRRDYDRLNNLGYFEKIDFQPKPGPDPKHPGTITLNWQLKEQRTGSVSVGAGYSGGATGTGLTGNVSLSENNVNGTGNNVSVKVERGSQVADAQLSLTIPHLGTTAKSQKYSLTTTLYTQQQVNAYAVYLATPAPSANATAAPAGTPVTLVPVDSTNYQLVSGVNATYRSKASGVSATVGRRLTDAVTVRAGVNVQNIAASATLPSGYYFPTAQSLSPVTATTTDLTGATSVSTALGLSAPSLAVIDASKPYAVNSLLFGIGADTRDDVMNPRRGYSASIDDEVSSKALRSDFNYQIVTLDAARFFPVGRRETLAFHGRFGTTTGAIPTTKLFNFSEQQLRGYSDIVYGTDILLGQAELRIPLTADRKLSIVTFAESGGTRIRGGTSTVTTTSGAVQTSDVGRYTFRSDVGIGLRFDIPQLGLRTLRLDFAKGSQGTHTSFGIGQSF